VVPATPGSEPDGPAGGEDSPPPATRQDFAAFGKAQQAALGSGTQNVYFGDGGERAEPALSIMPAVGQRDENLPLRGRDGFLAELAPSAPGRRVRIVHGLGGCGKTRLALEVAYRAQQSGLEVWWVSAAEESRLIAGFHALGRRLGVTDAELQHGEAADLIWRALSARRQGWLLVLDNADDPHVLAGTERCVGDGRGWLRPLTSPAGMVLVTSRDGRAASWGPWCGRHALGMLALDQAAQVLADYAGGQPGLGSVADAEKLAKRLGGLPLALKIAGSYLAKSAATPAAFADPGLPRTYQQYLAAIDSGDLDVAFPGPSGELTQEQARELIGRTWDLTLDLLDDRGVPEARKILRLLASFADAPIPYQILLHPSTMSGFRPSPASRAHICGRPCKLSLASA
jgi:NB-ARC domain